MNLKSTVKSLCIAAAVLASFVAIGAFAQESAKSTPADTAAVAKPTAADPAGFDVIGISIRTNNGEEMGGQGQIPKLWQRLFAEGVLTSIPDRADESIVAVYTDYVSDATGDYTYILGAKVKPGTKAPEGMVAVSVPAGKYMKFVTAKGPGAEVIPPAWMSIYKYFDSPANPGRTFKVDYELYEDMSDPNAMQGQIFVGVK